MEVHHVIKRSACRSDHGWNLLLLCNRCHRLAEGERVRVGCDLLPCLSLGNCLWLKCESGEWQPDELSLIRKPRRLPECEPLAEFFLAERLKWR